MRATRSDDTILEGAFVPDKYIVRVRPPASPAPTPSSWRCSPGRSRCSPTSTSGIAERARDLAIARVKQKTSVAGMTRSMAYHPEVQHRVAEMVLEIEGMIPHVERIAEDWSNGVDHGGQWPAKLVAAKYHCVESALRVVDLAHGRFRGPGHVQSRRTGAALPRRALRPLPSGELDGGPRGHRQDRRSASWARSRVGDRITGRCVQAQQILSR